MPSEFLVRIPVERIAVLIGPKGSTKKKIEDLTDTKLIIDSNSGDVIIIIEEEELEDPISLWKARDMVKAIGRGFSPQKAYEINKPSYGFDLLQLRDFVGTSTNALREVKSRLIGKNGRTYPGKRRVRQKLPASKEACCSRQPSEPEDSGTSKNTSFTKAESYQTRC